MSDGTIPVPGIYVGTQVEEHSQAGQPFRLLTGQVQRAALVDLLTKIPLVTQHRRTGEDSSELASLDLPDHAY